MKATVEKISSNKVKISFEIEAAKFDEGLDAAYRKNVKRINIPGFRKGKAPLQADRGPCTAPRVFLRGRASMRFSSPMTYDERRQREQ